MSVQVSLNSASKTFGTGRTAVRALRDVTLSISAGDMVVLCGPSGSGKTTLLGVVGAIERPDSGTVEVGGVEISGLNERDLSRYRRANVGFVFQDFNLLAGLTAGGNIELPMILNSVRSGERAERVRELLKRLGLENRIGAFPGELSAGERQRVAIARAVAHRPSLLLADEPTANLDSANAQEIIALLNELHEEENVTVLLATHDPKVIDMVSSRIVLRDGSISE